MPGGTSISTIWRYDVGPGLRYKTPVGPFRIDLGYQLNPIPGLMVNGEEQTRRHRFRFQFRPGLLRERRGSMRAMRRLLQVVAVVGTLLVGILAVALIVSQTPWFRTGCGATSSASRSST